MTPTVSIVMAAKNYARFLPMAVESVRAQTFADWELLIIDDGSSDETPQAVRRFLLDSRIEYFCSDRLGQSRAKNLGIGLSRGEFVAFLDADDAWHPTKLEKQLAVFSVGRAEPDTPRPAQATSGTARPTSELGVVFCRRSLIDESGRLLVAKPPAAIPSGRVLPAMFVQNFVCFSSVLVRREVFSHVGSFDPHLDLAVDFDLWLRVAKHYSFDFVDEELVLYRTGHGNLSKKLSDRVATAFSIMHRAETRYGAKDEVPPRALAEGYASTCRTIGYVMRASEPETAVKWYLRALRWPNGRPISVKGLAASVLAMLLGKRVPGAAENATVNV